MISADPPLSVRPRPWRPSISAVLTFGLVLGVLIAMGGALLLGLGTAQRNTRDLLRWQAQAMVEGLELQVQQQLRAAMALDRAVAERILSGEVSLEDRETLYDILRYSRAAAPQVVGAAFVDTSYRVVGSGLRHGREHKVIGDWDDRPDVGDIIEEAETYGGPWYTTAWIGELDTGGVAACLPLRKDGQLIGVMVSVVSMQALSEFASSLAESNVVTAFILYGRDAVLAHPALAGGPRGVSEQKPFPSLGELNDPILLTLWDGKSEDFSDQLGNNIIARVADTPEGQEVLLARPIDGYGSKPLYVGGHFPLAETGGVLDRLDHALYAAAVVLVATLTGVFLLGRSIARPIRDLALAARSVERLELDTAPTLKSSLFRETAAAAEAFNAMLLGLQRFSTYVPRGLVRRLVHRSVTQSEEREVTVLFTDIVGFTPLASALEPPELAQMLNEHFALIAQRIDEEGGTVDKYIGDCVMAFWGAPDPQPDHAARALRAAIGIAQGLQRDNRRRLQEGKLPIRLRLGLNSGPVVVGNVGAPGRINYTIIGDAVNTAQRLEALGRGFLGEEEETVILANAETASALPPGLAAVEVVGEIVLPGHVHPTRVVRVRPLLQEGSRPPPAT